MVSNENAVLPVDHLMASFGDNPVRRWWTEGWRGGTFKENRFWRANSNLAAAGGLLGIFAIFLLLQYWH